MSPDSHTPVAPSDTREAQLTPREIIEFVWGHTDHVDVEAIVLLIETAH